MTKLKTYSITEPYATALLLSLKKNPSAEDLSQLTKISKLINPVLYKQLLPFRNEINNFNFYLDLMICGITDKEKCKFVMNNLKPRDETLLAIHRLYSFVLNEMLEIAEKLGIDIIGASGTVLGACRHNNIIPWDDDVDTYMFLEDIATLRKYLEDIKSDYYIETYDKYGTFYKIRSRTFNVEIDIFPLISIITDKMGNEKSITKKIIKYCDDSTISVRYVTPRNCHPLLLRHVIYEEDMYPLREIQFGEITIKIPHNYNQYLEYIYGSWEVFPKELEIHKDAESMKQYI